MRKNIFGIVFILAALMLGFKGCSNKEKKWIEPIDLVNELQIKDTVKYELEYAIIFLDKKDVLSLLKKSVDEYNQLVAAGEIISIDAKPDFLNDIYLLNHLDSISGNFTLQAGGAFLTKLDTISIGNLKYAEGIQNIKEEDWQKDTTRIIRDYTDQRNFFFDSFQKIIPTLIEKNKVKIINRPSGKAVDKIVLKHHAWGISSYSSYYEFENGDLIIGKELILGL